MGNSNDFDTNNKFKQCANIEQKNSNWTGRYTVLQDHIQMGKILKKPIYLRSHKEASLYLSNYKEQDRPEFYVINPLYVELIKQDGICALSQSVNVYHKPFLPTLGNKLHLMRQPFRQKQIWFILSQISHSLEILHGRSHPHLWISPQTIYYNKDDNWFLQDMYYWRGPDYQNLINDKSQNQQLMSDYMRRISQKNETIDLSTAYDEDIYCFGYTLIVMMTGLSFGQVHKNSHILLEQSTANYSKKLLNLVKSMIQQIPERRLTLEKLRFKLKMDEQQIIKEEMAQFKRTNNFKIGQEHHKIQLNKLNHLKSERVKSSKIFHPSPPITNTTHHITPHSPLTTNQNSPFYVQTNRKNSMYFSPPTHRVFTEARSPSQQKYKRVVNQFRFNSPRN